MKLKARILIILVSVVLAVTAAYYSAFRLVILQSFIELDRQAAEQNMYRCRAALDREIGLLNRFVPTGPLGRHVRVRPAQKRTISGKPSWEVFRDQMLNIIHIMTTVAGSSGASPSTSRPAGDGIDLSGN
jgi:hypothetical protein